MKNGHQICKNNQCAPKNERRVNSYSQARTQCLNQMNQWTFHTILSWRSIGTFWLLYEMLWIFSSPQMKNNLSRLPMTTPSCIIVCISPNSLAASTSCQHVIRCSWCCACQSTFCISAQQSCWCTGHVCQLHYVPSFPDQISPSALSP